MHVHTDSARIQPLSRTGRLPPGSSLDVGMVRGQSQVLISTAQNTHSWTQAHCARTAGLSSAAVQPIRHQRPPRSPCKAGGEGSATEVNPWHDQRATLRESRRGCGSVGGSLTSSGLIRHRRTHTREQRVAGATATPSGALWVPSPAPKFHAKCKWSHSSRNSVYAQRWPRLSPQVTYPILHCR